MVAVHLPALLTISQRTTLTATAMNALFNVTPDSLATLAGVIDDGQGEIPDTTRTQRLKTQVRMSSEKLNIVN